MIILYESILSIPETRIPRILKEKERKRKNIKEEKNRELILSIIKEFIDIKKLNKGFNLKKQKQSSTDFENKW